MKHHQLDEQRLLELMRQRRVRQQTETYFRQMEERKARAQELRDRAARSSTEYRDNYRQHDDNQSPIAFTRHG
jgi:hypothetical protein